MESQIGELQSTHEQVQQEVQNLQKEGTEMKQKAKELHHSLETEKEGWDKTSRRISLKNGVRMTLNLPLKLVNTVIVLHVILLKLLYFSF